MEIFEQKDGHGGNAHVGEHGHGLREYPGGKWTFMPLTPPGLIKTTESNLTKRCFVG
jgi:hypothetical protein